jgi:hypothetical protein
MYPRAQLEYTYGCAFNNSTNVNAESKNFLSTCEIFVMKQGSLLSHIIINNLCVLKFHFCNDNF